jgi:PEP-CTERM/exosortase A-associated glycosyltransferase
MKVLHVLHHSIPYLDGYSIRSKYIVEGQDKLGFNPLVLTSANHEIFVGRGNGTRRPLKETIAGITYYRTPLPEHRLIDLQLKTPVLRENALMRALARSLQSALAEERVDIVHAHSPVLCGLPALKIAKRLQIPMVYEVRGFWEDAFLQPNRSGPLSKLKHRSGRALETTVFKKADAVISISRHMIDDIHDRGIDASHLHYMPNGVDVDSFKPVDKDAEMLDKLQLRGCVVIGFIGSFFQFEGLESLVRAFPQISTHIPTARLVLIGSGEEAGNIQRLVEELKLSDRVLQLGRVPHADILRYYSIMDVLVYPRLRDRMTELVTALKPLEAMAAGRAVVGSDVGGIQELFDGGRLGVLFKSGDSADLAHQVTRLLQEPQRLDQLRTEARRYVLAERSWDRLIPRYMAIYQSLIRGRSATTSRVEKGVNERRSLS